MKVWINQSSLPNARDSRPQDVVESWESTLEVCISLPAERVLRRSGERLTATRAAVFPVERVEHANPANHLADRRKAEGIERIEARRVVDCVEEELHRARVGGTRAYDSVPFWFTTFTGSSRIDLPRQARLTAVSP